MLNKWNKCWLSLEVGVEKELKIVIIAINYALKNSNFFPSAIAFIIQ